MDDMTVKEYELFLSQVNEFMNRRQNVTTVYLSVNAAISGAIAFLIGDVKLGGTWTLQLSIFLLIVAGIIACSLWRRLIIQYSILLGWWYEQLRLLEAEINGSRKLLTKEYEQLYSRMHGKGKIGLSNYEIGLSWLFIILYLVFGLINIVAVAVK